jgi:hypothetical protein
MLSVNSYSHDYVDATRAKIDAQLDAYNDLVAAARAAAGARDTKLAAAIAAFEALFFNHMVLALDNYFLHRGRNLEGKDGNPLNEVRVLCNSITNNDATMLKDNTIKMKPASSVLTYEVGDDIRLTEDDFRRLAKAFLAEIENKFPG